MRDRTVSWDDPGVSRSVLVTGSTGGLGPAVVAALAAAGWRVVAPGRAEADVATAAGAARAVELATADAGAPLRAVANLVGGYADGAPVATTPVEELERMLALNLRTTYLVTQAALPALAAAGGGSVVCFSSRAAVHPFAGAAGYAASKAAVLAFSRVVALEGAADGIRCNAVVPKLIATPSNRAAGIDAGAPPERVAAVVAWLCGDESEAVTGAEIPV
jgi:NAD(P)-dependent dehydrogenase (short-subunit alcohol dehydrogenase family)